MTKTTSKEPIIRTSRTHGDKLCVESIAVEDIDSDFPRYTFTESVVDELIAGREYDDSDGPDYLCLFSTDRPLDVQRQ